MSYWPIVVIVIGLEIVLALYKFFKGQWTYKIAIFNTIYEVIATIVIIVIMMNPNLFQPRICFLYDGSLFRPTRTIYQLDYWRSDFHVCDIWWMGDH